MPVAFICSLNPTLVRGVIGVTVIEVRTAEFTVRFVLPDRPPAAAAMIGRPLAVRLGDEVGVRGLVGIAEVEIHPHEVGEGGIARRLVAQKHLADGAQAVRIRLNTASQAIQIQALFLRDILFLLILYISTCELNWVQRSC